MCTATSIRLSWIGQAKIRLVPNTHTTLHRAISGARTVIGYTWRGRKEGEMSYISEASKFVRERYILVAEIDTVISAGVWNICRGERK